MTIRQRLGNTAGDFAGVKVKIVGDWLHSRVVRSNVDLLTALGAEVTLAAPPTLLPCGVESGPVRPPVKFDAEIAAAEVVMMLRVQQERMSGGFFPSHREYARLFGLSKQRAALMKKHASIMHPGPMLRGMELNYAVADLDQTAILQQVNNGVHLRMAVLFTLIANSGFAEEHAQGA